MNSNKPSHTCTIDNRNSDAGHQRALWLAVIRPYKWSALGLLGLIVIVSFAETIGLGLVLPLLQLITNPESLTGFGGFFQKFLNMFPEDQALLVVGTAMLSLIIVKNLLFILKTGMSSLFVNRLRKDWTLDIFNKYLDAHLRFHINHKQGFC